jgi:pSer/pThr/pTyr-binding forkhead associated (FHA) protein
MIKVDTDAPTSTSPSSSSTTALAGEASPARVPPPRLVLVEPPSGEEFFLQRPTTTIGRTPDNDIALIFKSVGRHHAEIVRDGDRYFVMDLKSANGVRVNGSACKRVPLRSGDIIGLGHVRLRFDRGDARPLRRGQRFPLASRARTAVGVALGIVGIALGVGAGLYKRPGPPPPLIVHAGTLPALPAVVVPPAPPADDGRTRALAAEQRSDLVVTALERGLLRREFAAVLRDASAVPAGSPQAARVRDLVRTATRKLVAQHLAVAERRRLEGRCGEARKEAEAALDLDSDNHTAHTLITRCARHASVSAGAPPSDAVALSNPATPSPAIPAARLVETRPPPEAPRPLDISSRPDATKARRRPIEARNPYLEDHP